MRMRRDFRKGALSWCQALTGKRIAGFWQRRLAALWHVVSDARLMSNNDTYSDFERLAARCEAWIRHLKRTWSRFDDVDAEIQLSMWQHYSQGVREERDMFRLVSNDVRRFCRREKRQWNIVTRLCEKTPTDPTYHSETEIEIVDRLGNAQMVAKLSIPTKARPWVDSQCGVGPMVSPSERMAGRRWANQACKVLAHA